MIKNDNVYDVCIVGSGPAGSFAAYELAKSGINVAVIEAGNNILDARTSNVVDEESSNISGKINFGFSQQVGGSSNLWSGGLARFYPIDLIERKNFGFEGWPIDIDELNKLYKRVDDIIGVPSLYRDEEKFKKDLIELTKSDIFEERQMIDLDIPFCTQKLVENIAGLKLFKNTMLKKFNINNNQISSFEVFDIDRNLNIEIKAKKYILAAGALTNIRIMLFSLDNYKEKFNDLYNNIGLYFSTHPKANIGFIKLKKPLPSNHIFLNNVKKNNYRTRLQIGFNRKLLTEKNLLNHCIRFDSILQKRLNKLFDLIKFTLGKFPIINLGNGYFVEKIANLGTSTYKFINQLNLMSKKNNISVRIFMDQSASKHNKIELSKKISKSGLPLAKIKWKFNEEDWNNVDKFISIFSNEIKAAGIGELNYKRPDKNNFIGVHSHFIGGTRCGKSELNSVVDKNLKVHSFDNLFISGPSVFPSFGYSNPFYTIAALSLRLSDHIKLKLRS